MMKSDQPSTPLSKYPSSVQHGGRLPFIEHRRLLYDLGLAWRQVSSHPIQTLITILVVGLAIALFVAVMALSEGLHRGIIQASDPFGVLVIGAKGSSQQLVLNTILLQDKPVGNIPYQVYEQLQHDPRVALAVPVAMGDNIGGARIIGTSPDFFTLSPSKDAPPTFQLKQGRLFQANFEAVLGSTAGSALGLKLGDQFNPQHGIALGLAADVHQIPHTVVGILQPTNSPYDQAVFTSLQSVWAVHEAEEATAESRPGSSSLAAEPGLFHQVTAILVKPAGFIEANELWREMQIGTQAQAAFPGQELGQLFDLLGQGQQLLTLVGYLAAGMAALTVLLALYGATLSREQAIAIMRSLGASRPSIFRMVMFEALIITLLGALAGRIIGYGTAALVANNITARSAIPHHAAR